MSFLEDKVEILNHQIENILPVKKSGKIVQATGLLIESVGPEANIGSLCEILSPEGKYIGAAEIVGFRDNRVLLMALDDIAGVRAGCIVSLCSMQAHVPVGTGLLGRIIDGLGRPIDNKGPLNVHFINKINTTAPNPMSRNRILAPLETGVRALDTFIPVGVGQRLGIFSGSGVGKSTLLGMVARSAKADINVIALIGERGRELKDFIECDLGPEGMKRSIIVIATSDQPAPLRIRAAFLATAIAESFRDEGLQVMLMMDSLTRLAMAQREIGLSIGEPPTARGYTPSVFALLPKILERSGMGEHGSITALYSVLVDGDDMNEPISDAVRGILDGHMVLSRSLASANHYPAIDVLQSISRLESSICSNDERAIIGCARDILALYRKNEDLITIGAYVPSSNPKIDFAISKHDSLLSFLKQDVDEFTSRQEAFNKLQSLIK